MEIGTVAAQVLFWENLYPIFGIGSLQCISHLRDVVIGIRLINTQKHAQCCFAAPLFNDLISPNLLA